MWPIHHWTSQGIDHGDHPDAALDTTPDDGAASRRRSSARRRGSRTTPAPMSRPTGSPPGRCCTPLFLFVVSIVRPFRRYFDRPDDFVSETFLIIDPEPRLRQPRPGHRDRAAAASRGGVVARAVPDPAAADARSRALRSLPRIRRPWTMWVGLVVNIVLIVLFIRAKAPVPRAQRPGGGPAGAGACCSSGAALTVLLVGGWLANRYGTGGEAGVASIFGLETLLQDIGAVQSDEGLTVPFWVRAVVNLLGAAVVLGAAYVWFRSPKDSRTLEAKDEARVRALLRGFGTAGLPGVLRDASGQVRDLGHRLGRRRHGRGVLPRRRQRGPGQREPRRRPGALADGDRAVPRARPGQRLVHGRHGGRRGGRGGLPEGRAWTPSRSATRRSWTSRTSPSRAGP